MVYTIVKVAFNLYKIKIQAEQAVGFAYAQFNDYGLIIRYNGKERYADKDEIEYLVNAIGGEKE